MQGHIHKRVTQDKNGKETTRWYVVVDVGSTTRAGDGRSGTAASGLVGRPRSLERSSSTTCTQALT